MGGRGASKASRSAINRFHKLNPCARPEGLEAELLRHANEATASLSGAGPWRRRWAILTTRFNPQSESGRTLIRTLRLRMIFMLMMAIGAAIAFPEHSYTMTYLYRHYGIGIRPRLPELTDETNDKPP